MERESAFWRSTYGRRRLNDSDSHHNRNRRAGGRHIGFLSRVSPTPRNEMYRPSANVEPVDWSNRRRSPRRVIRSHCVKTAVQRPDDNNNVHTTAVTVSPNRDRGRVTLALSRISTRVITTKIILLLMSACATLNHYF